MKWTGWNWLKIGIGCNEVDRMELAQDRDRIQQLQQAQEQLPYYYIREIPNKPPPPYTPPGKTCGAPVPCGQAQVTTFTRQATEHLHAALMTGEGLTMVELPQHFLGSGHQAVFRRFLFDLATRLDASAALLAELLSYLGSATQYDNQDNSLCYSISMDVEELILIACIRRRCCSSKKKGKKRCQSGINATSCVSRQSDWQQCQGDARWRPMHSVILHSYFKAESVMDVQKSSATNVADAYGWEEPKPRLPWEWPLCSHRKKKLPPRSRDDLHDIVQRQVSQLFGFAPRPGRDNLIVRWSRRKRDCVDDLLMRESHEEEAGWTNYDQDEVTVKNEVTVCILNCLLDETARVFKEIFDKRSVRILET
uniref:Uncharacterized protein n=1 Tax=Timema shepardi TaxID=629360 RepID=A0A7R9ANX8_TIMSH|nr:unnamed protein product [Timema shepardi]